MEEHEVKTVLIQATSTFRNVKVIYEAEYFYCDNAEELYMDEQQFQKIISASRTPTGSHRG